MTRVIRLAVVMAFVAGCTGSSGTAIEDIPTSVPAAPTATRKPAPTRVPTATPVPPTETPVPATEVPAEPTATPTREAEPEVPALIVDGDLTWPPGAPALTKEEQDAINLGISYYNLIGLVLGNGADAFQSEYDALAPHLTPGAQQAMDGFRESPAFLPSTVIPGRERDHRTTAATVAPEGDGHAVALCFNLATTNAEESEILGTVVFAYETVDLNEELAIGTFEIQGVEQDLRDCSEEELSR